MLGDFIAGSQRVELQWDVLNSIQEVTVLRVDF